MKQINLSIIIPLYNNLKISQALESIKKVKDNETEVIVVDGGSKKEVIEIVHCYNDFVDVFISEPDDGPYDAANKGIKRAKGKWIFWFASDDILLVNPNEVIKKHETQSLDVICGSILEEKRGGDETICRSNSNLRRLLYHCSLRQPASFFKKQTLFQVGLYNLQYKYAGDRELFLRLYKNGASYKIIDDIIVRFGYGGLTTSTNVIESYKEDYDISLKYGANPLLTKWIYWMRCVVKKRKIDKDN